MRNINIVDTTGAGDSFIGGFIFCIILRKVGLLGEGDFSHDDATRFSLLLSSWIAGNKIKSMGARGGIPDGKQVDEELGVTIKDVQERLKTLVYKDN